MSPQRAETANAVTTTGLTEPVQARAWPGEAGVSSHGMISYQQLTGFNQPVDTINQERDHTEQARLSKDIDTEYYSENEIVPHFICLHNSDSSEPTCKHIGCQ